MAIPGRMTCCSPWNGASSTVIPAPFSARCAQLGPHGCATRPRRPSCNMGRKSSPSSLTCRSPPISSQVMEAAFAPLALGRPFLVPPGVPVERLAALREAFAATMVDPEFLAEGEKMGLGLNAPRTGAQIQAVMERAYQSPPRVIDRLRQLNVP